jgi:hypothetical protein
MDALDARMLVAASPSQSAANRRWRVRDNLPGTAAFCPMLRKARDWMTASAVHRDPAHPAYPAMKREC